MCTLEKGLASRKAISIAGRALASSQLEVDAMDLLQLSEALVREENCHSAVVPTCLVFKMAFPPL